MQIQRTPQGFVLYKENTPVGHCQCHQQGEGWHLEWLKIDPAWQNRGYGSFFLKKILAQTGGFQPESLHTASGVQSPAAVALLQKFQFRLEGSLWRRVRQREFTPVNMTHLFLQSRLKPGGVYLDATCGNGYDTEFLCRLAQPEGRVLALDIQPQAVDATNARLKRLGLDAIGRAIQADHQHLEQLVQEPLDCAMFNLGYLPGADHSLFTQASSTQKALAAAITLLRAGGILSVCLYSGGVNGFEEKQAILTWLRQLPISQYTVVECGFSNWAEHAPLPCFVIKK